MNCTNCGNEVPETANVCGYCGHRLKSTILNNAQPVMAQVATPKVKTAPPRESIMSPQANVWRSVLIWALPISVIDLLQGVASLALFYTRLGGNEISRLWNQDMGGLIVNTLIMVTLPCAIAGYLVARDWSLRKWALGGLLLVYAPLFISHFFFFGVSYGYVEDHPVAKFFSTWTFIGPFAPLIGALIGRTVRKFS